MTENNQIVLGVNHQFLYIDGMTQAQAHTDTLALLAQNPLIDALDCWVWPQKERAREEIALLRECGKTIHYNIGDRIGEPPAFFASPDKSVREEARGRLWRELDVALAASAKKIVIGSGADVPQAREAAVERFTRLMEDVHTYIPGDVTLTLEPTDRDVDKRFLFGPVDETVRFIASMREGGFKNFGMLLDMGHIPLMHTTIGQAVRTANDCLEHVHLGNCILKNPQHPLYGDRHPALNVEYGEYAETQVFEMTRALDASGYFKRERPASVSFEMRTMKGLTPEETLRYYVAVWDAALKRLT